LTFAITLMACSNTTPNPTDALQATQKAISVPPTVSMHQESTESAGYPSSSEAQPTPDGKVLVPGLRIFYLRAGNLWSWTEAGGLQQLTNTGDMLTIRVSDDGQLLAFMRGSEVWIVGIDGTDARLIATQIEEGGLLWFAPSSQALAVSTSTHIDIIYLNTGSTATVTTYPALQADYVPEVAWMSDSFGFKTIIPAPSGSGEAEMMFVFTDGTIASLAKFITTNPSESPLYFSPDGGYVIYVAKTDSDKESLYLMDSSGATRPYGDAAKQVRAYGWMPDSKHFVYGVNGFQESFIGTVDGPPERSEINFFSPTRWIENESYLALQNGDLILGNLNRTAMVIDSNVEDFDFQLLK